MAAVTCGLTAEDRDQLRNPSVRFVYGLSLPFYCNCNCSYAYCTLANISMLWLEPQDFVIILSNYSVFLSSKNPLVTCMDINNLPFDSENISLYLVRYFFQLVERLPVGYRRPRER